MTNRHHRRGGRTTPRGSRPASAPGGRPGIRSHRPPPVGPPFLADARTALADDSPLGLLSLASTLVQATTPQSQDRLPGFAADRPDATAVFLSFTDPDWPPLNALALAASVLVADVELADRIRQLVHPAAVAGAPAWLEVMDRITITGVWLQTHVLGDGDNILIGWSWPGGQEAAAVVYIDHNVGTLVKDAFVVHESIDDLLLAYRVLADADMSWAPFSPADARARIIEGLQRADMTIPPFESDSWPLCRPLVAWVVGQLPAGGTGYERPEWSEAARRGLIDQFLDTPHGAVPGLDAELVRDLVDPLVWFACDYGPGDPLRWSPVSVEIVLADWYPRKVFSLDHRELRHLPEALAAFVRFCHAQSEVRAELTADTEAAIEEWTPTYLQAVARPGRSPVSNAARLARLAAGLDPDALEAFAALDDSELDDDGLDDDDEVLFGADLAEYYNELEGDDQTRFMTVVVDEMERGLEETAGGADALAALDDDPLPDRPFDWSVVPDEHREVVGLTLEQLDRWAVELYDAEVGTIGRAVLAGMVAANPGMLKRSAKSDILAAAVLYVVANRIVDALRLSGTSTAPAWKVSTQKELGAATGLSAGSISTRARTVRTVMEHEAEIDWPALLHSAQRREMVAARQLLAEWRAARAEEG